LQSARNTPRRTVNVIRIVWQSRDGWIDRPVELIGREAMPALSKLSIGENNCISVTSTWVVEDCRRRRR
jgi:hypothetical protein